MMPSTQSLLFCLICFASAKDPIVQLIPNCPSTMHGEALLELRAEVPAYAIANCKNGHKDFITSNDVQHRLLASLDPHYIGHDCLFYKRYGMNTFTVEVEVGWGQAGSDLITKAKMHTLTCSYDEQGKALSARDYVAEGTVAPGEIKSNFEHRGTSPKFDLTLVDVLDKPIPMGKLTVGRKVRLQVIDTSNSVPAFRAVNCVAKSGHISYSLLTDGCGDGVVFDKVTGFNTVGHSVYSPYFEAFKLEGSDSIHFECNFTVCSSGCDGDSCLAQLRKKYSDNKNEDSSEDSYSVTAASNHVLTGDANHGVMEPDLYWKTSASDSGKKQKVLGFRVGGEILKFLFGQKESTGLSKRTGIEIVGVLCVLSPFLILSLIMSTYLCCSQPLSKRTSSYNGKLAV